MGRVSSSGVYRYVRVGDIFYFFEGNCFFVNFYYLGSYIFFRMI